VYDFVYARYWGASKFVDAAPSTSGSRTGIANAKEEQQDRTKADAKTKDITFFIGSNSPYIIK
jgi:hypothetical protein